MQFSIIIPTYNSAATIIDTMESMRHQTFADFEVLIMDGQSTDDTLSIVRGYALEDNRIRVYSEKDKGVYDAMNKGIKKAKGEWLFFLGSDDSFYNPEVLSKIHSLISNQKNTRFIYGNVNRYKYENGKLDTYIHDGKFDELKLTRINICHQAIFYHRSLFHEFGQFNTNYKLAADWDFNLRCFRRADPVFCDTIIANFFAQGISGKNIDERFENDLLPNMIFTYPYPTGSPYFGMKKKRLMQIIGRELRNFHLNRAFRASCIFLRHLKPAQPN